LLVRALAIREKTLPSEHPELATTLNNLASVYAHRGSYAEAESLHRRALAIKERALGPDHPDVAAALNNLAELYRAQGRFGDAEPLYRQALAIWERSAGTSHAGTAATLGNLAELYRQQGRYAEAEPLFQRALAIKQKGALAGEDTTVARLLARYAALLRATKRKGEAAKLEARARDILQRLAGGDYARFTIDVDALAKDRAAYSLLDPQ
jgi:tetratricopeptide (TPR) repeat protein